MTNKKRLSINMFLSLMMFVINLGISFFLTPYVTENVGVEVYGFISLANNFVNYASLLTIALNSMAGRYITIYIHQDNIEEANKYFTSIFAANAFLSLILLIPSIICVIFLDKFISIPTFITNDVKILFLLVFINFFIGIMNSVFSVSTYAANRLDISSLRNLESNIIRVVFLILFFSFLGTSVSFIGVATCISSLYVLIFNIIYTKKLLPNIKIKKIYYDFKKVVQIIASGIWNTITKLGQILSDGLDLLLSNIFIDSVAMGQLAVAKTLSTIVNNLICTVTAVFQPQLTIHYAKNNISAFVKEMIFSMKLTTFFSNIVICGLIAFGYQFINLWLPNQNVLLIYHLTVITIAGGIVSAAINSLFDTFTITNKLKVNSIVTICLGFLNVLLLFFVLKFTNLGIYAIAGISILVGTIKNLTFTPIYASKCLNISKKTFYPTIFKCLFSSVLLIVCFTFIGSIFKITNWLYLIAICGISGVIGLIINFIVLFNKTERDQFIIMIKSKIFKKKVVV